MNRLSLKYRIAIIIFVLEAIMISMVLWQSQKVSFETTHIQHEAYEQVILAMLGDLGRYALINEEYDEFQTYVEKVLKDPHVLKVVLTDFGNRVMVSTDPGLLGRTAPDFIDGEETSVHALDLSNVNGQLGRLTIEFTDSNLIDAYRRARIRGLSIAGISMTFIALVSILIGYILTRRLSRLQQAARCMAEGDLDITVNQVGSDEVAELSRDFSTMAGKIKANLEELQTHRDNLEEMVKDRTEKLQQALDEVKTLSGFLPICAQCKKIRNDNGYWDQIESYIQKHSEAQFSHSICPECAKQLYPDLDICQH